MTGSTCRACLTRYHYPSYLLKHLRASSPTCLLALAIHTDPVPVQVQVEVYDMEAAARADLKPRGLSRWSAPTPAHRVCGPLPPWAHLEQRPREAALARLRQFDPIDHALQWAEERIASSLASSMPTAARTADAAGVPPVVPLSRALLRPIPLLVVWLPDHVIASPLLEYVRSCPSASPFQVVPAQLGTSQMAMVASRLQEGLGTGLIAGILTYIPDEWFYDRWIGLKWWII